MPLKFSRRIIAKREMKNENEKDKEKEKKNSNNNDDKKKDVAVYFHNTTRLKVCMQILISV